MINSDNAPSSPISKLGIGALKVYIVREAIAQALLRKPQDLSRLWSTDVSSN